MPDITLNVTPEDGEPHDCVITINELCTPRVDVTDTPLDGSSRKNVITGVNEVGYAVATQDCVVESASYHLTFQPRWLSC